MKVYKFGGASVKDAAGIKNLAKIVKAESDNLVIVVSAFGKTTNALEKVLKAWLSGDEKYKSFLDDIYASHLSVVLDLFGHDSELKGKIDVSFALLQDYLMTSTKGEYDFEYDQVVSSGELWSTMIVAEYLKLNFQNVEWCDIRKILLTDDRHRDANVLWTESTKRIRNTFDFKKGENLHYPGFYRRNFCRSDYDSWP